MKTLVRRTAIMSCLLFLSLICFSVRNGAAQPTFYIDTPKVVNLYEHQQFAFRIMSNVSTPLTLNVTQVDMDEHIGLNVYDKGRFDSLGKTITIAPDSLSVSMGFIFATYTSLATKDFESKIILLDPNTSHSDTIVIRSGEIGSVRDKDYITVDEVEPFRTGVGKNEFHFTVRNSGDVKVKLAFTTSEYNLTMPGSNFFDVPAKGSTDLLLNFIDNQAGSADSLEFTLTPITPTADVMIKRFWFKYVDTIKPYFAPVFTIPSFWLDAGMKECKKMTISNKNDEAMTISVFNISGPDASVFEFLPTVAVPFTIAANSSLEFTVCATAPNNHNRGFYAILETAYGDAKHHVEKANGSLYGYTNDCVTIDNDTIVMGPILAGGTVDGNVTITNSLDKAVTFTNSTWDEVYNGATPDFDITNITYPFTLDAKESKTLNIHLRTVAGRDGYYLARYQMHYEPTDDSCNLRTVLLLGTAINADDSSHLALFPSQTEILPIVSNQQTTTKKFTFTNNSGASIKVLSVSVVDGTHFSVASPLAADLPITMSNNGTLDVDITFDANSTGFYNDSLVIVTDLGLKSQKFSLQALRSGTASVDATLQVQPEVLLSPNPAQSQVAISTTGLRTAAIEIYDVLGNKLASQNTTNLWFWNIANTATDGSYFVRVSGVTTEGKTFIQTKRLVVTR